MKKTVLFCILALFLSFMVHQQITLALDGNNELEIEKEIWALEEAYISYHRDAAHEKVIPMWHERFLGWPHSESRPADKDGVVRYLKRNSSVPGAWSFKIEKTGIRVTGNIAIVHYNLLIGWGLGRAHVSI